MQTDMHDPRYPMVPSRMGSDNPYLPSTDLRSPIPEWEQEEIHLRDYLDVLLRRKWLIISVLVLTFVTTLILTLSKPKLYESSATMEIAQSDQNVTNFRELSESTPRWLSEEYFETQVQLITNPAFLARVVDRMQLAEHPVIQELFFSDTEPGPLTRLKQGIRSMIVALIPKDKAVEQTAPVDDPQLSEEYLLRQSLADYLMGGLEVTSSGTNMLMTVSFLSEDPMLSRDVTNAVCQEFINWKMEQRLGASSTAQSFLMKQIDRSKINLEKAEEEMNQFAKAAGIVSMDTKLNGIYRELEGLNGLLADAESELIHKESVYKQALADGPSNIPQVMSSPMIAELKAEYARLESEHDQLSVTFQPDYPAVKAVKARMDSVAARIAGEEEKIFQSLKNDYLAAKHRVDSMQTRVAHQKQLALELNERATQYKIMAREVETNKSIYESLLHRSREIESMVGVASSNITVVSPADLSLWPSKPNVRRNLLLAIVVGLMAGVGLAFLLEYFNDAVTNPEEISDRFQIPILGIVPVAKATDHPVEKTFLFDPRAPMSEAMRTTRVSLQLSGSGPRAKSFLITSTKPGEGKTTMAANLALTFAGSGEKVVIVDADMRKPRIHKIFSDNAFNNAPGLSSFLAGVTKKGVICRNGIDNLHFIPSGPIPPNPVELLASKRFEKLMRYLEKRFDRVIVDAPPHQGFADVLVLAQSVGGVVLATGMGEAKRDELRHFKKSMLNVRATILGCIINKVDTSQRYGYQSYYRYYSYAEGPAAAGAKQLPERRA